MLYENHLERKYRIVFGLKFNLTGNGFSIEFFYQKILNIVTPNFINSNSYASFLRHSHTFVGL